MSPTSETPLLAHLLATGCRQCSPCSKAEGYTHYGYSPPLVWQSGAGAVAACTHLHSLWRGGALSPTSETPLLAHLPATGCRRGRPCTNAEGRPSCADGGPLGEPSHPVTAAGWGPTSETPLPQAVLGDREVARSGFHPSGLQPHHGRHVASLHVGKGHEVPGSTFIVYPISLIKNSRQLLTGY